MRRLRQRVRILRQAQDEAAIRMILPNASLMIFLILSLSKDAGNHPARTSAEGSGQPNHNNQNDE
jgi:hypothetical protein